VPFDCLHRQRHGVDICLTDCPTADVRGGCHYARVERQTDLPPADPAIIDVALLDMHHGWPNLGHDAIVSGIQNVVCDLQAALADAGLAFRVTSYDVRRGQQVPEPPGGRHAIYVGTGGPGYLDPGQNDGVDPGSQGIREDPAWEPRLFDLFDRIRADRDAALLAVCHTFGVMCRWLGVADAVRRPAGKGGKSAGIVENILTPEAASHPWFGQFAQELPDRRRCRVLDSRLYDLIPREDRVSGPLCAIGYETVNLGGPPGEALTMLEVARTADGTMPRVFGVNHHPEIVNRPRQLSVLRKRMERGEVTAEWYAERAAALTQTIDDRGDDSLRVTSTYTFLAPLRFYLHREARARAAHLGRRLSLEPEQLILTRRPPVTLLHRDERGSTAGTPRLSGTTPDA
jgi:hypothetical protein